MKFLLSCLLLLVSINSYSAYVDGQVYFTKTVTIDCSFDSTRIDELVRKIDEYEPDKIIISNGSTWEASYAFSLLKKLTKKPKSLVFNIFSIYEKRSVISKTEIEIENYLPDWRDVTVSFTYDYLTLYQFIIGHNSQYSTFSAFYNLLKANKL